METRSKLFAILFITLYSVSAQENPSKECQAALDACENDIECSNRLSPLMAACTTGTCQPQCRNAVLNVYQNKLGRTMLRTDASCIPGRDELRTCNFLPTANVVHCSLAKLACEADLQCNSKWGVFISECENEAARGECSSKCHALLNAATATPQGAAFNNCSCTEREDQLCETIRDNLLAACNKPTPAPPAPGDNSITDMSDEESTTVASSSLSSILFAIVMSLIALLL